MKVIFVEDDRIENVAEGYARNYLLPRKLAFAATPQAEAAAAKRREIKLAELEKKKGEMQALADKLEKKEFTIKVDAGEGGKLFGSVTSADIAELVAKEGGVEIDKKKIELEEPLKTVGEHTVAVKLFHDVTAKLKIIVAAK